MKKQTWYIWVALALVALSVGLYLVDYAVFRDTHQLYLYLVSDLAFLPLSVLLVTLVIDKLLSERDKRASMEKMNMVIGAFFSELGTGLIKKLTEIDPGRESKQSALRSVGELDLPSYKHLAAEIAGFDFKVRPDPASLESLRVMLVGKRDFMVRLLENPMLLEHESFTDMLWAVFHLTEELESRGGFEGLPASDMAHLGGDAARAYGQLTGQWLAYMRHLKRAYPYLFSLALRLNPFDPEASVLVE
ncbi:MAG: hypothetical protein ACYC99_13665 [Candidatus Geothermincolia bacterium]